MVFFQSSIFVTLNYRDNVSCPVQFTYTLTSRGPPLTPTLLIELEYWDSEVAYKQMDKIMYHSAFVTLGACCDLGMWHWIAHTHSDHMTFSKWADTLICNTTIHRNPINFLWNLGQVILWCVEVGPVANAKEGSTQEHDRARVAHTGPCNNGTRFQPITTDII